MFTKSQSGSALLNALMASSISIIVAYVVMSTKSEQIKVVTSMSAPISAQVVKSRVLSTLMTDRAMQNTMTCNASGTCPHPTGTMDTSKPNLLALYNDIGTGQLITDSRYPNSGFTTNGEACDEFNPDQGNDSCPFRYELTGTLLPGPPMQITVHAHFILKAKSNWIMNLTQYDFDYSNTSGNSEYRSIAETCKSFGNGTIIGLNQEKGEASCSTFILNCGGSGITMGSDGIPICNIAQLSTPVGCAKFMGFDSKGLAICQ